MEVDKVAEAFGKLTTDPTSGLIAMAKQFHNVTAEQIAYVAQLQRSESLCNLVHLHTGCRSKTRDTLVDGIKLFTTTHTGIHHGCQ